MSIPTGHNYKAWQNPEAVTLTSIALAGNTVFPLTAAKRRAPTFKELSASGGVYTGIDLVWLLPKTLVDAANATGNKAPKPGDLITDGGSVAWTILERSLNHLQSTYRCVTRDMVLAYDLRGTLTVKRPTDTTTDSAGSRTYTYATVYTNIPCRFQDVGGDGQDERGQRLTVTRYGVWVGQRLYLTIEDQIINNLTGDICELKGWKDADRIDQLQQIDCEKRWAS